MENKLFLLSIILPVYNESEVIESVLGNLKSFLDKSNLEYEILCINDGSNEADSEILRKIPYITLLEHKRNKGYGAALKTGILNAKYETIIMMDSDGQHNHEDITKLIKEFEQGYDMVVGSREITNTNKSRVAGKFMLHLFANYLIKYRIPDLNSGLRIFKKSVAKKFIHLCSDRFSFTTSLTLAYLSENYDIKYVPIKVASRKTGKSYVNMKAGFRTFLKVIQIVMVFSPLRVLLPVVACFFAVTVVSLVNDLLLSDIGDTTVLLAVTTVIMFVFSLMSDQLSTIRKEKNE